MLGMENNALYQCLLATQGQDTVQLAANTEADTTFLGSGNKC